MADIPRMARRADGKHPGIRRIVKWALFAAVCFALCVGLASFFVERSARRMATQNGAFADFSNVTAQNLDENVKAGMPLRSTHDFVEGFLTGKGMPFTLENHSQEIYARAENLKGSGLIATSLVFTFHFDATSRLTSIDSRVSLTGP
jgi:hypothetical protein